MRDQSYSTLIPQKNGVDLFDRISYNVRNCWIESFETKNQLRTVLFSTISTFLGEYKRSCIDFYSMQPQE